MTTPNNPRIFLCHADEDKPKVEPLYHHLQAAGYFPWLDKFDLLPGQDWWTEIQKIIGDPYNLVVVCLSKNSTPKRGVVQQEITRALDVLDKMPEGAIYLIPARLEFCDIPTRLSDRHYVDLFENDGFDKLEQALQFELANREQEDPLAQQQSQIEELERKIKRRQTSLHMYEENLRLEDDDDRRRKLQESIDEIKDVILAEQTELARIRQALSSPTPPSPVPTNFIANAPYGLETALVGREAERLLLDDWFYHDEGHPLLAMIALGGMGKSALTWDWLQDLIHQKQAPPLVVWWSFYETDGAMDKLMVEVLKHFGDDPTQFPSLRAAVMRFIEHLRQTPALLVLDGFERLLRAYSSLAAAYQGDEDDPAQRDHARQCTDPVTGQLLLWLAQPGYTRARTLLTSRLFPLELAGRGGTGLQGVRRHDLTGLTPDAAYALFQGLRIRATRAEVEAVCAPLGYHPLSLRLLARTIAVDPQYRNDIKAAVNYDPTLDLLGRQQHVLSRAYDTLPPSARDLLGRLAAFRSSVAWDVIVAVFGNRREDILVLERRGLVQRTELTINGQRIAHYDLHPIVRRYAYNRLTDPTATHTQLVIYFEAVPEPERVRTIDDLRPTIELYHHLAHAGRYDEAVELFRDRLAEPLYYQLGAYRQCIELLRVLFPDGVDQLPCLSDETAQGWTLAALGNSYSLAGQRAAWPDSGRQRFRYMNNTTPFVKNKRTKKILRWAWAI